MLKSFAALLLTSTVALAQNNATAYDALRTLGNQLNRDAINRVISITGVDGNPQPETWHIVFDDRNARGGLREVEVSNGRVSAPHAPVGSMAGSAQGATVDTRKLNLDSSGAYEVASHTADSSHVPFALVSYTLRTDDRGNPTWIVTLHSQNRRPLGTIYIGANKGTVTRTEGMFQGLPMDSVVEQKPGGDVEYSSSGRMGPLKDRARELFGRARDQAQDTFKRVRHNFADFIRGED